MMTENQPMFSTIHSTSVYYSHRIKSADQLTATAAQKSSGDLLQLREKIQPFVHVKLTGIQVEKKRTTEVGSRGWKFAGVHCLINMLVFLQGV